MASLASFVTLLFLSANGQEFNITDFPVAVANDSVYSLATPSPTQTLYPCDYIDPAINGSNCGACVANDSCIWCTSDQSCHLKQDYNDSQCMDSKSGDNASTITGAAHLYECCNHSTSCPQCTTLEYVLCDWCISTKTCFNASMTGECHNGEDGDYGKHIVFKDGQCRDEEEKSIWDKFKHYYLEIPFTFRCVLDSLLALCLLLLCVCCCLCVKTKINKRRIRKKYKMKRNVRINSARDYLQFKESK